MGNIVKKRGLLNVHVGAVVEPPPRFATFKKHRKIITRRVDLCAVAFTEIPDVKFMQVFINVLTLIKFSHVMHTTFSGGGGIRWGGSSVVANNYKDYEFFNDCKLKR